jgi:hypothetical protein
MTRIEPHQLIPAYRQIKKKPIRGEFVNKKGDGCCGMSAMAVVVLRPRGIVLDRYNIGKMAREHLGVSESYFAGFVTGWDDRPQTEIPDDRDSIRGYSDGRTNWEACCEEGLVSE